MLIMPVQQLPEFRYFAPIEGVIYLFEYFWHDVAQAWYWSISTAARSPLMRGIKLVCTHPLTAQYRARVPQAGWRGEFYVGGLGEDGQGLRVTERSLQTGSHRLYYLTPEDVARYTVPATIIPTPAVEVAL